MFCSKQEDVGGERSLETLAEQKKGLQSPTEPVQGSQGQNSGEKGAEAVPPRNSASTTSTKTSLQ